MTLPVYPPVQPSVPEWADPNTTWDQLIAMMRFWLKPDDYLFTDEQLMYLMLAAPSFGAAVIAGWNTKIRWYADPSRVIRSQIGSESLEFSKPGDLISWAKDIVKDLKHQFGMTSGGSRVLSLDEYPQVYGVTPYRVTPPPYLVPSTWGTGVGSDLSRGIDNSAPGWQVPPPLATPKSADSPTSDEAAKPEQPKPKPTVRPRRT